MYDVKLSSSIVSSKSASSIKKSVFNENGSNMHLGMTHKCLIYQGGVCIILKVNVKCLLFPSQHKKKFLFLALHQSPFNDKYSSGNKIRGPLFEHVTVCVLL